MLMISGNIKQSVKLAQMNQEWLLKKEKGILKREKPMTAEKLQIKDFQEQAAKTRENSKFANIEAKIQSGDVLTSEEIDYLKKNNPDALRRYEEARAEKKAYERQLKNCRTKEDVERLKIQKVGGYLAAVKKVSTNPNIPKSAKLALLQGIQAKLTMVQEAHIKFVKSAQFKKLPTDEELLEERKEHTEEMTGETVSETAVPEKAEEKGIDGGTLKENEGKGSADVWAEESKVDFDEAVQFVRESLSELKADTYDRSGGNAHLEPEWDLGKKIDLKR